jgi:hypothetical protein
MICSAIVKTSGLCFLGALKRPTNDKSVCAGSGPAAQVLSAQPALAFRTSPGFDEDLRWRVRLIIELLFQIDHFLPPKGCYNSASLRYKWMHGFPKKVIISRPASWLLAGFENDSQVV